MTIQEKVLAPNDPNLAQCLESYAALLRRLGRDEEAGTMETRVKHIRSAKAGK